MLERLKSLTFIMILIGALYAFDGINHGALSANSVTGLVVSEQPLGQQGVGCYDSDNRDYYTKGTTYANLFKLNGEGPQDDTCQGHTLVEYYCVFNEPQVELYDCPIGCVVGSCVR